MISQTIQSRIAEGADMREVHKPEFFRLSDAGDRASLEKLLASKQHIQVYDTLQAQVRELIKTRSPKHTISDADAEQKAAEKLASIGAEKYGVWVYYPWSERLVHILDEEEFIEMRTNRNKYKITGPEQEALFQKRVGVIGLSVGQSVSLTMAMERTFGELRIADFDELEITNLNRLRSSIHNMGLKKTILVAREIAEIDPFLKVTCFHEGISATNIESFLLDNGKLDVLIDECDSVDIKINCRTAAKKHRIPVVMEASDRGTIDIERFDLEPDRPILHGFVEHLDISKVKGLKTMEEKLPYILPIVGIETMSTRLKASAVEVGQTISTWPQLASAVTMGGGITADVCRRILLDHLHISGRFFIDLDELIGDPAPEERILKFPEVEPLTQASMKTSASMVKWEGACAAINQLPLIEKMMEVARQAPSAGNMQPWQWFFDGTGLYLFHDRQRSAALADFRHMTSYLSMGTAIEHIYIEAKKQKVSVETLYFPLTEDNKSCMVAAFRFKPAADAKEDLLGKFMGVRRTNRNSGNGNPISQNVLDQIRESGKTIPGAKLYVVDDSNLMAKLANIAGKSDKLRIFIEEGHFDLFHKELKFAEGDPALIKEGLDVRTLDLKPKDQVGFRVIKDRKAINLVASWGGGSALESVSHDLVMSSSATVLVTMPGVDAESMIQAGRAVERIWLTATANGVSVQPMLASVLHFARIVQGGGDGIPEDIQREFLALHAEFVKIFGYSELTEVPLFFMRLCYAEAPKLVAQRLELDDIFSHT